LDKRAAQILALQVDEPQSAEQERADVAKARRHWIRQQGLLDPTHLLFIDETSINTSMTRLRGRSPRREPVIDLVPLHTGRGSRSVPALYRAIRSYLRYSVRKKSPTTSGGQCFSLTGGAV
jgi:hypothetical protein